MQHSKLFKKLVRAIPALFVCLVLGGLAVGQVSAQEVFRDCDDCPEMVVIPAGSVMLGSYENEAYHRKDERGKQKAEIKKPFAMARTEVTVGQYRRFMEQAGYQPKMPIRDGQPLKGCNFFDGKSYGYVNQHSWQNPGFPQREDSPVLCVSWSDAEAFSKWLSEKTDRTYRVPSTVEFEYAVRAGSETPWPWGTNPDLACEYANIADQTFARAYPKRSSFACDDDYLNTASVAKFKPNQFGLYDMIGNAWEWTNDCWHDDLSKAPLDGTSWQQEDRGDCTMRTPKGGSWISGPAWARAAVHAKDGQHYRSFMLGFRVAAEIDK